MYLSCIVHVFVWVCAPATACVEVREHPWELVLAFRHVVPELVIRLGGMMTPLKKFFFFKVKSKFNYKHTNNKQ